ncbi:hypothetical protein C2R22_11250 [Salinigranum rubrum]|uniref:Uncharacterized protein n=1 Tax=Salinigranum rubrum TaxID=755307 RepID=A0A2I8VJN9_9EURY|nr:hypothetical protein C2R22_11250 [Salinigranum rubrum]
MDAVFHLSSGHVTDWAHALANVENLLADSSRRSDQARASVHATHGRGQVRGGRSTRIPQLRVAGRTSPAPTRPWHPDGCRPAL